MNTRSGSVLLVLWINDEAACGITALLWRILREAYYVCSTPLRVQGRDTPRSLEHCQASWRTYSACRSVMGFRELVVNIPCVWRTTGAMHVRAPWTQQLREVLHERLEEGTRRSP
jgi:hypothetical protein